MGRTVVVDAANAQLARDLAAGGAFVAEQGLALNDECELVLRRGDLELKVATRVVYVDPVRGAGLELLGVDAALREQLGAFIDAIAAPKLSSDDDDDDDDKHSPAKKTLHARIRGLTLAAQIKMAHDGDVQERILLERMYGKNVWEPLLRNPRLTAPEITRLARMGTMPRILVEVIVGNGTWLQMPDVRRALLTNPKLGIENITKILRMMPKPELRLVPTQTVLPLAVRDVARRLLRGE